MSATERALDWLPHLRAASVAADAAFDEVVAGHERASEYVGAGTTRYACSCGFEPRQPTARRTASRSVGLHLSAVQKRAARAWDAAFDATVKAERGATDAA